ncbi:hypothetical protein B9T26_15300 [Acinetobacter sp. ANC 4169]|jgi:hypothetical protein|uniref:cupin domain-containing protein n=1 Tax=Acinetobacter sp. ANC 4169 TaxID=1977879 RepID=UPI000A34F54B|nr:cupin domain-containing protein [Acinetobacter sp. ANC 4169]OTG68968.1 hypothetical protein B9T26_15300 [Acinetobacter sp. ANC 4169]
MKKIIACVTIGLMSWAGVAAADQTNMPSHVVLTTSAMKWGEAPSVFPKGASFTVLSGDPSKAGIFVIRLKMPAGYKIMPHWHPTDEHVTVISGTFSLGMGEKFNKSMMKKLPVGGYAHLPAEMRHYAMAVTPVTVQVEAMGPFALTYVNPADDPSKHSSNK